MPKLRAQRLYGQAGGTSPLGRSTCHVPRPHPSVAMDRKCAVADVHSRGLFSAPRAWTWGLGLVPAAPLTPDLLLLPHRQRITPWDIESGYQLFLCVSICAVSVLNFQFRLTVHLMFYFPRALPSEQLLSPIASLFSRIIMPFSIFPNDTRAPCPWIFSGKPPHVPGVAALGMSSSSLSGGKLRLTCCPISMV